MTKGQPISSRDISMAERKVKVQFMKEICEVHWWLEISSNDPWRTSKSFCP